MWNPTPSLIASSTDNKQNIGVQAEVDDCKCSGGGIEQQQKINNSKTQTPSFAEPEEKEDNERKFLEFLGETIDSGFISGPQAPSSDNLETNTESESVDGAGGGGEIKLITSESMNQKQQHSTSNLDSGIIEEYFGDDDCDFQEKDQATVTSTKEPSKMLLPNSAESGISEWFCNLSLHNNPNAANDNNISNSGLNNLNAPRAEQNTPSASQQHPSTTAFSEAVAITAHLTANLPQQITPSNAWEKYYQQNDDGDTSLHLACIFGNVDVVAALIRMSPHPCLFNIKNDTAQTPLHLATLTAQPKIIRMLLIAGADPTIGDRRGNTALHLACMSGEEQCVRALIIPISASEVHEAHRQYGHRANDKSYLKCAQLPSDLEIRNYDGERCVHIAAQAGFINILRILVLYGADINAREGIAGRTPLHFAIECYNEDLVNYLLDDCQKLNLETATYAGLTAYQVACILKKSDMQNILEKRGAEPLSPPESDYDSSDSETDLDDSKSYNRFGDPGYFVGFKGGNVMTVA